MSFHNNDKQLWKGNSEHVQTTEHLFYHLATLALRFTRPSSSLCWSTGIISQLLKARAVLSSNYKDSLPLSLLGNLFGPYCAANDFERVVYNLEWDYSFVAFEGLSTWPWVAVKCLSSFQLIVIKSLTFFWIYLQQPCAPMEGHYNNPLKWHSLTSQFIDHVTHRNLSAKSITRTAQCSSGYLTHTSTDMLSAQCLSDSMHTCSLLDHEEDFALRVDCRNSANA